MAFNLESMTVDYKTMYRMVPSDRFTVAQSGIANDLLSSLTPGQLANLFPRYYSNRLPDIGNSGSTSTLGGALSGGTSFGSGGGGLYSPASVGGSAAPSKTAQQMAVERILSEHGVTAKTESTSITGKEGQILATIRHRESRGNYSIESKSSSASGAYQFIDSTWQTLTAKYGIGTEFSRAAYAPPSIQDAIARAYVKEILAQNGGDASKVPLVWYTGNAQGKMSAQALAVNGGLTPQQYQANWMNDFGKFANIAEIESSADSIKRLEDLKAELVPLSEDIRRQLDAKTLEIYDRGTNEQKWNIEQAIKLAGVQGFNQELNKHPINEATVTATSERFSVLKGNIDEVNPKLQNVINAAAGDLPPGYTVKAISGRDSRLRTGTKNHPAGLAMDVQIYDGQGNLVPHNSNSPGWKYYEMLYRSAHIRGQQMYPDDKFIWGGAWISDAAGRGDPMHYQIVDPSVRGSSQSSGRYSFDNGLDPSHPFVREGGQLSAEERQSFDASVYARIQAERNASDPVTAAQSNVELPPPPTPSEPPPAPTPAVPAPALASGGTVEMTPGENVAGINTTTGQIEFMSNDRELYTKDDQGNLRVDPSTIRQDEQPPQPTPDVTQRLEAQNQPVQSRPQQPMPPSETTDPNFLNSVSSGSMSSSPSQLRALNRAKLYTENSSDLINGHFS